MVADAFIGQVIFICFIAMHMNVCWAKVAATQFAIYMAWSNLSRSIGAGVYGELQPLLNYGQEFMIMGFSSLAAAAVLFLINFDKYRLQVQLLKDGN